MYVIEIYDHEGKKSFIKELTGQGAIASYTKKKTEAKQWNHREQACVYAARLTIDTHYALSVGRIKSELLFNGFKVIKL